VSFFPIFCEFFYDNKIMTMKLAAAALYSIAVLDTRARLERSEKWIVILMDPSHSNSSRMDKYEQGNYYYYRERKQKFL